MRRIISNFQLFSFLVIVLLFSGTVTAFPLLDRQYLELMHNLSASENQDEVISNLLSTAGIDPQEKPQIENFLKNTGSEESIAWSNSIFQKGKRTNSEELVAAIIQARNKYPESKVAVPLILNEHQSSLYHGDAIWPLLGTYLEQVLFSEDLSAYQVKPEFQQYLDGFIKELDEQKIKELKDKILELSEKRNVSDSAAIMLLTTVYLAQNVDLDFLETLYQGNFRGKRDNSFYYSMLKWQNCPAYVEHLVEKIEFWNSNGADLSQEENRQVSIILSCMNQNKDEEEIQSLVLDLLLINPGRFYPYIDQLAGNFTGKTSIHEDKDALIKQALRLQQASDTIRQKFYQ